MATESVGIRFEAQDDASATTQKVAAAVKAYSGSMADLERAFSKFDETVKRNAIDAQNARIAESMRAVREQAARHDELRAWGVTSDSMASAASGLAEAEAASGASMERFNSAIALQSVGLGALLNPMTAVGAAVGAVTGYVVRAIAASNEHETAMRRLSFQVQASGTSFAAAAPEIERFVESNKALGVSGNETLTSIGKAIALTGSYTDALRVVAVAQDAATARSIPLETALTAVGKVATGNTEALAELAPSLKGLAQDLAKSEDAAARAAVAMDALEKQVGGTLAASMSETTKATNAVSAAFQAVSRSIGDAITQSDAWRNSMLAVRALAAAAQDAVTGTRANARALVQELAASGAAPGLPESWAGSDFGSNDSMMALARKMGQERGAAFRARQAAAEKSGGRSPYTRDGEDARGAVDAYNERNKAIEEAQAAADARRAAMVLAADTALGDARYAQRQAEVERMTQLEIAAEEERMRVSQSVQQQIAGFAQGTFDELGRGFARLVLTGKFGAKEFGAAMLGMTGQQAAARGALWLGEGLAMLFAGNPAGAAVAAQGAGLIALGGTLSAASSTLSGRAGGAAGAGASAASVPTFDRGTRRDDDRERSIVLNINTGGSADAEQHYHAHVLRRLVERGAVQAEGMRVNLA